MTHTYHITEMTCAGCSAKVSHLLKRIPDVTSVSIDLGTGDATITMVNHVATSTLQEALKEHPKYKLTEKMVKSVNIFAEQVEEKKSWAATYKPILLIFGYITAISLIVSLWGNGFSGMMFMQVFMAGFFLIFSFFKMLDLKGFANSYAMYDIVAKKFKSWGYIYAFLELGLGLAFALGIFPLFVNAFTAVLMSVSLIGVLQSVMTKKKIQCACLGAVFNLPMSTVTIIEDGLMIAMSVAMLFMYL
ncbi:heavy metal translocating P-type ATPase [Flavobacterium cerinum]|uniref:Heavy-metal-associated domain-containing protein n=1 Tax=Flavobacterium cerinum TaxID=2502784 RepID=A0A3S3TYC7_9FLAO|nr:cation transporter [Flavobacterium cerinum]RWW96689.1 heavy-metal-associated domain-containing protein [Flavobacterium cerinum]